MAKARLHPSSSSAGVLCDVDDTRNAGASAGKPARVRASALPRTGWKDIADAMQQDIERGVVVAGDVLPSETQLTQKWKVSRMTAHRAMQELQRSGFVTRQRGRGTVVSTPGRQTTGKIALLFHQPLDRLEIEYIRGISSELADQFQFLLCDAHGDVELEAHFLKAVPKEADGLIFMPSGHASNTGVLQRLVESNYPLVCVDRLAPDVAIDGVISDNFGASSRALRAFVANGHRRIAHFTQNNLHLSAVRERYDAFLCVMREAGEDHPERLVQFLPTNVQQDFGRNVQIAQDALVALRHQSDPPTAIFCVNDYCLMLLLAALEQLELQTPRDIEVLTFHDVLTLTPLVCSRLTRIVQEPRLMGQLAAQRLQTRIANPTIPTEVTRIGASIHRLESEYSPR